MALPHEIETLGKPTPGQSVSPQVITISINTHHGHAGKARETASPGVRKLNQFITFIFLIWHAFVDVDFGLREGGAGKANSKG